MSSDRETAMLSALRSFSISFLGNLTAKQDWLQKTQHNSETVTLSAASLAEEAFLPIYIIHWKTEKSGQKIRVLNAILFIDK